MKLISRKYKIWLLLCCAIVSFAYPAEKAIASMLEAAALLASAGGSNEKCADETHSNRENMLNALFQLASNRLVINHYEADAMQSQLHKSAFGNNDPAKQVVLDSQYAIDKWNKDRGHAQCRCFLINNTWYDLNATDGKWHERTDPAAKTNEAYIIINTVRFEQDSTDVDHIVTLISGVLSSGKNVFLNTDDISLKEKIEKEFSYLLGPKPVPIEPPKSTNNTTQISSYMLAFGGFLLVGCCVIAMFHYFKKI